jgi:predicted transcriptional regulator of viral defense system
LRVLASKRSGSSYREGLLALASQVGVLRPADLTAVNIPRDYLRRLVEEGQLKRVERGLYRLAEAQVTEHHALVEATRRVPRGVICLCSALAFHHLTPSPPEEIWLAIDRDVHAPQTTRLPLHIARFSGLAYTFGVETHQVEGVAVRIYSPAKTVADCFKYRYKLGLEVALEALRETWYTRKATLSELWEAARVCRVTSSMRPYLEMFGI